MDKVVRQRQLVERTTHEFYCDECGNFLGTTFEYDDGYFKELGEVELEFYLDDRYQLRKTLCPKCKMRLYNKIGSMLNEFGFKQESWE